VPVTGTYLPMVPVILPYTRDFSWKQRAKICKNIEGFWFGALPVHLTSQIWKKKNHSHLG
jgi:hypothetical protein